MRKFILWLALGLACCSCTKAAETAIVSAIEAECVPLVSLEAPAAAPLCVFTDELIQAVGDYIFAHAGATPAIAKAEGVTQVAPDLYASLAARPAIASRRARSKCSGGTVAP